jgi:DNA adenine methylase
VIETTGPMNSPFRYPGGKFYARKLILTHLPKHVFYAEPFAGGASIFFAKDKVVESWLNDLDPDLINCLETIRDYPEELISALAGIEASKEKHHYFKNEFVIENNLDRAKRWYYLNRTSYSGIMNMKNCYWGYGDKYSMRPENWPRNIRRTSAKLQDVKLTNGDFETVIENAPDGSFLFIDPPYFNRDQDKFYEPPFPKDNHIRLCSLLEKHKSRINFLITYDNDEIIRDMYSWAEEIHDKEWNYMIYRTDDQSKEQNGESKDFYQKRYKGKEIFILNYDSKQPEQISLDIH